MERHAISMLIMCSQLHHVLSHSLYVHIYSVEPHELFIFLFLSLSDCCFYFYFFYQTSTNQSALYAPCSTQLEHSNTPPRPTKEIYEANTLLISTPSLSFSHSIYYITCVSSCTFKAVLSLRHNHQT